LAAEEMTDARAIERARQADIVEVARRSTTLKRVGADEWAGPCPRCGGTDRFSINARKQIFNCRGCGAKGDTIALVQFLDDDVDFPEAIARLTGERPGPSRSGRRHPKPGERKAAPEADEAQRLMRVGAIWAETEPLAGTDGEGYLVGRGIVLDDVPDHGGLRWHLACPWETGTAPCVVARYTDAITAEPRGIWRRPIDGQKPRSLGPTAGCVIRLWPDDMVELGLVIGEGVETTLAAATRITHKGTYLRPAWAGGSSSNMAAFPLLAGVVSLTLLVDHDENGAGERAAEQCAIRWADAGKEVTRLMPGDLGDFNDLVRP
jgi:hypothetical protein